MYAKNNTFRSTHRAEQDWDLVGNKDEFKKYIREEVSAYSKKE